jgi:hypothetical protein
LRPAGRRPAHSGLPEVGVRSYVNFTCHIDRNAQNDTPSGRAGLAQTMRSVP